MANKIQLDKFDEGNNQLKKDITKRNGMGRRKRNLLYMVILLAGLYWFFVFIPIPVKGSLDRILFEPMRPAEYGELIRFCFAKIGEFLSGQTTDALLEEQAGLAQTHHIFRYMVVYSVPLCLRNYVGVIFGGAALAVTGASFQGAFRNSIASPTTLGVMSGGTVGATVYIMWGSEWFGGKLDTFFTNMGIPITGQMIFVLVGCFAAVLFTLFIALAAGGGKLSMVALLVTGMVFSTVVSSFSQVIQMHMLSVDPYGEKTIALRYAMMGHFYFDSNAKLLVFILPVAALLVCIVLLSKRLNLIVFGEDEARAMGINVKRTRNLLLALCTVLTALVITNCGSIGFVGLIIPHITRKLVGADFRYLIPGSILVGATFLLVIYNIPSCSWMTEPVSSYSSIVGGIMFMYIIIRNRRKSNADWA